MGFRQARGIAEIDKKSEIPSKNQKELEDTLVQNVEIVSIVLEEEKQENIEIVKEPIKENSIILPEKEKSDIIVNPNKEKKPKQNTKTKKIANNK